jgi:hypothetical protein
MTTTPDRDLRDLLKAMDKEGYTYALWLVPQPHNSNYEIRFYEPQVEGRTFLGTFKPKARKK